MVCLFKCYIWVLLYTLFLLLLHSPPTNLPNVVHGLPCQLDCTDLLSGVITFPYQILNLHEIIHSLKNLHDSHRPEIPVKFPDLSECIITTFHQHLLQIQCYDDCSLIQLVLCYIPLLGELPVSTKSLVKVWIWTQSVSCAYTWLLTSIQFLH